MAGIYIHIPFCKQACTYCNFHFSTSLKQKDNLLHAIHREIDLQSNYLSSKNIDTIYFGGGTPSVLSAKEINQILHKLQTHYSWDDQCEVTLEANPDDIHKEKLISYRDIGINRLSIGIQSFFEEDLQYMRRSHDAGQARKSIDDALQVGFDDISIDLIFGAPTSNPDKCLQNLEIFKGYDLPHLSSYALTVEPKTILENHIRKGKKKPILDTQQEEEYRLTMNFLEANGYEHYEISNYAKKDKYAKHNTSYWQGKEYLGLGPSAHSYNGHSRKWNVPNNALYIKSLNEGSKPEEIEVLTEKDKYNELVMISLRTKWGIEKDDIPLAYQAHFDENKTPLLQKEFIYQQNNVYYLTQKGKMMADAVCADLFYTRD